MVRCWVSHNDNTDDYIDDDDDVSDEKSIINYYQIELTLDCLLPFDTLGSAADDENNFVMAALKIGS